MLGIAPSGTAKLSSDPRLSATQRLSRSLTWQSLLGTQANGKPMQRKSLLMAWLIVSVAASACSDQLSPTEVIIPRVVEGVLDPDGGRVVHPGGAWVEADKGQLSSRVHISLELVTPAVSADLPASAVFNLHLRPEGTETNSMVGGSQSQLQPSQRRSYGSVNVHLIIAPTTDLTGQFAIVSTIIEGGKYYASKVQAYLSSDPKETVVKATLNVLGELTLGVAQATLEGIICREDYTRLLPVGSSEDPDDRSPIAHVIFVHGWQADRVTCKQWAAFDPGSMGADIFYHLRERGLHTPAKFWRFTYPTFMNIGNNIDSLAAEIDRLIPEDEPIVLIGHSMGGLVASGAAQKSVIPDRILGIVTLGTPHLGAALAQPGFFEDAAELNLSDLLDPASVAYKQLADLLAYGSAYLEPIVLSSEGARSMIPGSMVLRWLGDPDRLAWLFTYSGDVSLFGLVEVGGCDHGLLLCSAAALGWLGYAAYNLPPQSNPSDGIVSVQSAMPSGSQTQLTGAGYNHWDLRTGRNGFPDPVLQHVAGVVAALLAQLDSTPRLTRLEFTGHPGAVPEDRAVFPQGPYPLYPPIEVVLLGAAGDTVKTAGDSVSLTLKGGTTGAVLDGETVVASSNGIAVFANIMVDSIGEGYTLVATSGSSSAESVTPFRVTKPGDLNRPPDSWVDVCDLQLVLDAWNRTDYPPEDIDKNGVVNIFDLAIVLQNWDAGEMVLTFPSQPRDVELGQTFGIVVELQRDGTPVECYHGPVRLELAENPGGATLSGILQVEAVAGVATFTGLSLDQPGIGYALRAMTGTEEGDSAQFVISEPFNVSSAAALVPLESLDLAGWVYSAPAVGPDGSVYVASVDGNLRYSYLQRYRVDQGLATLLIDAHPLTQPATDASAPVVAPDGRIIFASNDGSLHIFKEDGDALCTWEPGVYGVHPSTPAVAVDGSIVVAVDHNFGANGRLWGFSTDCVRRWSTEVSIGFNTGRGFKASPGIGSDAGIYAGHVSADSVYAFSGAGARQWALHAGGPVYSSVAIDPTGLIYVGAGAALLAMTPNGTLVWSRPLEGAVTASPVIGMGGTVYIGDETGVFYAVDGATGTVLRSVHTGETITATAAVGQSGRVYVTTRRPANPSILWAFTSTLEVIQKVTLAGAARGHYGSSPTIANGRLYVGAGRTLHVFAVTDAGLASSAWPSFQRDEGNGGRAIEAQAAP
jgi:outer membrane protein assembly factor BamB/pimeloyl-ACP methyl ester carboxylesterase